MPVPVIRTLDTLRKLIVLCQFVLMAGVAAAALLFCARQAEGYVNGGALRQQVWDWLIFPSFFVSCVFGTLVGRLILGRLARVSKAFRLSSWYHPAYMFRDWLLLSIAVAALYWLAFQKISSVEESFRAAGHSTILAWYKTRGALCFGVAALLIVLMDRMGLVQPRTLTPRGRGAIVAVPLIAALTIAPALFIHRYLGPAMRETPDLRSALLMSYSLIAASLIAYAVFFLAALFFNSRRPPIRRPIEVRMAIAGTKGVGKTVFLTRAYSGLRNFRVGSLSLDQTDQSRTVLSPIIRRMEANREWPPGSVNAADIPFVVRELSRPAIQFNWIDVPGGVFEDPDDLDHDPVPPPAFAPVAPADPLAGGLSLGALRSLAKAKGWEWSEARQAFEEQLRYANAVVMLFNAEDLKDLQSLDQYRLYDRYRQVVDDYFRLVEQTPREDDHTVVAIIVSQIDRVKSPLVRRRIRAMMKTLTDYWIDMARDRGFRRPTVRVFLSSAVSNAVLVNGVSRLPDRVDDLKSENCTEPLLWIAAKAIRAQAIVFDDAKGFFVGRTHIHQLAIKLEDASQ